MPDGETADVAHWEGLTEGAADVDAAYREYVASALQAVDRPAFYRASLRFMAALRNGHSQFFDSESDGRPLKFRLLEIEGQWVVIASRHRDLARGDVVTAINRRAIEDFVGDAAQYVHASNRRLARTHVFSYPTLFPEQMSLQLLDGRTVTVDRSLPDDTPPAAAPRAAEGRWLRDQEVAYIRVPSFGAHSTHRDQSVHAIVITGTTAS